MVMVVTILLIVVVIFVVAGRNFKTVDPQTRPSDSGPLLPINPINASGVSLGANERLYYKHPATWQDHHTERQYTGGYSGVSLRVAKGVTIHSGGSRGRSKGVIVAQHHPGVVYLTNKRVIFVGRDITREIAMRAWTLATHYSDGVTFAIKNHDTVAVLTHDPSFVIVLNRIIENRFDSDDATLAVSSKDSAPTQLATTASHQANVSDPLEAFLSKFADLHKANTMNDKHNVVQGATIDSNDPNRLNVTINPLAWDNVSAASRMSLVAGIRQYWGESLGTPVAVVQAVSPSGNVLAIADAESVRMGHSTAP